MAIRKLEVAATVDYTLARIAQTVIPHAQTGRPAYTSNICHAQVAKGILKRGNPDDRIQLFGAESGDVIHSILTDENDRVIVDAWASPTNGNKFLPNKGYKAKDDVLPLLADVPVSALYDKYQR